MTLRSAARVFIAEKVIVRGSASADAAACLGCILGCRLNDSEIRILGLRNSNFGRPWEPNLVVNETFGRRFEGLLEATESYSVHLLC